MSENDRPYEVGYKKPPTETRFKKGQSGNPRGRPKKKQNFLDMTYEEMWRRIRIKEGADIVEMPAAKIVARTLVNGSIKGDLRMLKMLIDLWSKYAPIENEDTNTVSEAEDLKTLESVRMRLMSSSLQSDGNAGD